MRIEDCRAGMYIKGNNKERYSITDNLMTLGIITDVGEEYIGVVVLKHLDSDVVPCEVKFSVDPEYFDEVVGFEVGDKVKVKEDIDNVDSVVQMPADMLKHRGKSAEISNKKSCGHYNLNIDEASYCWDDTLIERDLFSMSKEFDKKCFGYKSILKFIEDSGLVEEEFETSTSTNKKFEVGDVVKVREDISTIENFKYGVNESMCEMAGKEFTVTLKDGDSYELEGCIYVFGDEILEEARVLTPKDLEEIIANAPDVIIDTLNISKKVKVKKSSDEEFILIDNVIFRIDDISKIELKDDKIVICGKEYGHAKIKNQEGLMEEILKNL